MNKIRNTLLASGTPVPTARLCKWLGLPRSTAYYQPRERKARPVDEAMAARIKQIHQSEPACAVRGTWKVHRIMKLKGWTLPKRRAGSRPRFKVSTSITPEPNQRWATDLALIHCGKDGWCVFVPVIDCCSREILGHALERTGRAKTAERALEEALLGRFGALRSAPPGMLLRHDNGLVFGSRQFRAVVKDYGLQQEYITPYTPQQNGLCERFIKTLQGGVLLVQPLRLHRARQTQAAGVDPCLQPRAAPPVAKLQDPEPILPNQMQQRSLINAIGCPTSEGALHGSQWVHRRNWIRMSQRG